MSGVGGATGCQRDSVDLLCGLQFRVNSSRRKPGRPEIRAQDIIHFAATDWLLLELPLFSLFPEPELGAVAPDNESVSGASPASVR
jgi:hypothetical protein